MAEVGSLEFETMSIHATGITENEAVLVIDLYVSSKPEFLSIADIANEIIASVEFYWTKQSEGWSDEYLEGPAEADVTDVGSSSITWEASISNLEPGETYEFKAYVEYEPAVNGNGNGGGGSPPPNGD